MELMFWLLFTTWLLLTPLNALPNTSKRTIHVQAAIAADFADPAIIWNDGQWWAFATNNHHGINVQVATSKDFSSWTIRGADALPKLGDWVNPISPAVWAPDVIRNARGKYIMYYSARPLGHPAQHCIGVAQADRIEGPYIAFPKPFSCPLAQGGAIDASGFLDDDDNRYVVYKIDGNSIGLGGNCGNGIAPLVPTPIMLQKVEGDGFTPVGNPIQILDRGPYDGPLVEAPSLMHIRGGKYILFFSSNCFSGPFYDISYAVANSISGPYVKASSPFAITGTAGLYAPGGLDVAHDGRHAVFHASNGQGGRGMFTTELNVDSNGFVSS